MDKNKTKMIKIYHNNRCSKSRCGLALLEESGKEFEVVKYLDEVPSEKELKEIKEISANAIELDSKNTKLTKRNQELEIQLETLVADNTRLKDDKERSFMIIGGGLIILGIILGLAIPAMRGGRKSSGWS